MSNEYSSKPVTQGVVRISEHVIRSIATISAKETDGVAGLAEAPKGISRFFSKEQPVEIQVVNDMVEITVRIILKEGIRLTMVAGQIQENIRENVQNMTGVIVSKIHVVAAGISYES